MHDDRLILPVLDWLIASKPRVGAFSAPQGAGKTTLVKQLIPLLEQRGIRAVGLSIDDFYLRREEQLALAAAHPGNPYLEHRGYPGTHDVALGVRTLEALRAGRAVELPRYDKTAHGGRGDRSAQSEPVEAASPGVMVLLEGWMLGFTPVATNDALLQVINEKLAAYEAWYRLIDVMVCLRADDPSSVLRWRVQAEEAARASGKPALSVAAIEDYVRRFLPAYELYAGTVSQGRWSPDRQLVFTLADDRTATKAAGAASR